MQAVAVTVLMPVYNAEPFLREAMDSILSQTFTDFEFLIINDGSTDKSEEIILSYTDARIRYYKNETNLKLIATLNRGFDLAQGKYIARMDADDISLPQRLQVQYNFMEKHPEVGLSGAFWDKFSGNTNLTLCVYEPDHETICFKHLHQIHVTHGTAIFRTSVLREHGLYFNADFPHAEDYEFWSRLSQVTKLANVQQKLYRVREHENEVSIKYANVQQQNSNRVKKILFNKIGVEISDADLLLFEKIAQYEYEPTLSFLTRGQKMLEHLLLTAHDYDVFFSESYFKNQLATFWFNINYNTTATLGAKAYGNYYNSPLAQINPLSFSARLKFLLKSLLRK